MAESFSGQPECEAATVEHGAKVVGLVLVSIIDISEGEQLYHHYGLQGKDVPEFMKRHK